MQQALEVNFQTQSSNRSKHLREGQMKLPRRQFLHMAAGAVAMPAISREAWPQAYPSRPVRILVTFPPGSTSDVLARPLAQWLRERLGQPFVIDNRPGAGGTIGTEAAVRASPDGYTLLLIAGAHTVNATLYDKLSFDFIRDIAPIAGISRDSALMTVNPSFPAKTFSEFIAFAKANPGKINMASAGVGSPSHVTGELFKMMTGVEMVHVPYRGSPPALTDVIAGQVQVTFQATAASIPHVRSGALRALAVTTASRSTMLPDLPTVGEFVPGYEASAVWGLGAPRNIPDEIVDKLNKAVNAALTDPRYRARLTDMGVSVLGSSPADFAKLIAAETEKWGKVVKFANIKPE
jgi:tripartite-type tricarboxylate transporter receptor subunit TctC